MVGISAWSPAERQSIFLTRQDDKLLGEGEDFSWVEFTSGHQMLVPTRKPPNDQIPNDQ